MADCPVRLTLDLISSKWSVVVLRALGRQGWRHGELQKLIGGISSKVLTQNLRRLMQYGLVTRVDFGGVPRRVEYTLTDLGHSLLPATDVLVVWAERHGPAVMEAFLNSTDDELDDEFLDGGPS